MKRMALALLIILMACGVVHANARGVRKTAEASMLVTGHVQVNPDGTLRSYSIDHADQLPEPVRQVIASNLPHWAFQLSGPSSKVVDSSMSLRVLAHPQADGNYALSIGGTTFDKPKNPAERITSKQQKPPSYPEGAVEARVSGTVYLLLQIGRDGTVRNAVAEQVNLDEYGTELQMKHFRELLANKSLHAARAWTFNVPSSGPTASAPYWVVRVPVNFHLNRRGEAPHEPSYGQWQVYIPGPREYAPWADQRLLSEAPDALPDGTLHELGTGLRLKTPQSGG
jgi:hypothetical protein